MLTPGFKILERVIMKHNVYAIILAAGKGHRMGGPILKQYMNLVDRPVLAHTIASFDAAPSIDALILVTSSLDQEFIKEKILNNYPVKKPVFFVVGGSERQESVWNAINSIEGGEIVAVHDGVRPLISIKVIEKTIIAAKQFGAAAAGMPVKDTIKEIDNRGFAIHTPDRSKLWLIQTPQTFQLPLLMEAHIKAREDFYLGTDDCSLVERLGHPVKLIEGHYSNIKITTWSDIDIAMQLLNNRGDQF